MYTICKYAYMCVYVEIRRLLGHEPRRVMKLFPQTPLWEGFPLLKTVPWTPQSLTRGSAEYHYSLINPFQKKTS